MKGALGVFLFSKVVKWCYSRLGYEIKRDFTNFSQKIAKGLIRPQEKFVQQMVYGILAGNKLHLSEIARSLKENITLKKSID